MAKKMLLSVSRQNELIWINRVLALLVVGLALFGGYLLAVQQSWLVTEDEAIINEPVVQLTDESHYPVTPPRTNRVSSLLLQARYARMFEAASLLGQADLSALMWAAQGKITSWGERTVPSYKSQFPLEMYVLVRSIEGVDPGWYSFDAVDQQLMGSELLSQTLSWPSTIQPLMEAAAILVVTQPIQSSTQVELAWHEGGIVAHNILLMSHELGLATMMVPGLALPEALTETFNEAGYRLLYVMPIGNWQ